MCVWININRELQSFSLKCKFGVFLRLQGRSAALGTSRCGALLACARETLALIRLKKQTSLLLWVHFLCGGRRCSLERGDCHNFAFPATPRWRRRRGRVQEGLESLTDVPRQPHWLRARRLPVWRSKNLGTALMCVEPH